jgi:WD40 repeat protein
MTAYGIVAVWDLRTSTALPPAAPFSNYPASVVFAPESMLLIVGLGWSGVAVNKVLAWDLERARFLDPFGPHIPAVDTLALSPTRPLLAIASRDDPPTNHNSVRLWDYSSRRSIGLLEQTKQTAYPVRAMAFSPDGQMLAVADHYPIHLWDVKGERLVVSLVGHKRQVNTLAFTPDGQTLLSGDNDAVVRAWDVGSGRQRAVFDWGLGAVRSVAVAPDGMTAAAGGDGPDVMVWDLDVPSW